MAESRHGDAEPAGEQSYAHAAMSAVAERERDGFHLPQGDRIDVQAFGAGLQARDTALRKVEGARHGAQVDPLAGGATLDVRDVAEEYPLTVLPGVRALLAGQHAAVDEAAERRSVAGARQVVRDGRPPHRVVGPVVEPGEQDPQTSWREAAQDCRRAGTLGPGRCVPVPAVAE
ncbi:hypothetical protein GCM10010302_06370 [Streptomyces polychromogenes]|uniref:Uncharacterized protein n=1 Tax=Streptomyces polychromogenes TaxID=67342 RepID=A0ABP3ENS8_9ACTN